MVRIKDDVHRLEELLANTSNTKNLRDENIGNIIEENVELEAQPLFVVDFNKEKEECEKEARNMITKAIQHIFSKDQIKDTPYLKDKLKLDITSLAGMLYQNKCAELMQKALMEEIGKGASSPRHFEVFSGMSRNIAENNKQLLQTVEAIKTTYLGIRADIVEKETMLLDISDDKKLLSDNNTNSNDTPSGITMNGGYSCSNHKDMLKEVQNIARMAKTQKFDDAEIIN